MRPFLRIFLFLLLVACNGKPAAEEASAASRAKTGLAAPNFALKDTAGKTVNLADFKGKVVLLDFWATWCPPCRMSTPAMVRLNQKFKGKDVSILGISLDEEQSKVPPYIKREKVEHTILYGNRSIDRDYGIRAVPTFYLLDSNGNIVKQYEGYYPGMEKEWEKEINVLLSKK